jgi:hypothetical protein
VIVDWWDPTAPLRRNNFTTVASWWSQGYQEFDGKIFGPKAEEMRKFIDLPARVGENLEIVLDTDPRDPDIAKFKSHGWAILDPHDTTPDVAAYRDYIAESAGEFSCVKGLYAGTQCGWFSDRSACYLAAGRPVVLQDTGLTGVLPLGKGLYAISSVDEAADAIRAIRLDYEYHSKAAREIAMEHFESNRIISHLLEHIGIV